MYSNKLNLTRSIDYLILNLAQMQLQTLNEIALTWRGNQISVAMEIELHIAMPRAN